MLLMTVTDEWIGRYVKDKLNISKIENLLDHFLIKFPQESYEKILIAVSSVLHSL